MNTVATAAGRPALAFAAQGTPWQRALDAVQRHRRLLRMLLLGFLWAVAITAVEAPNIPNVTSDLGELGRVTATFLTNFGLECMLFAAVLHWVSSKPGSWMGMAVAIFVVSLVAPALIEFTGISTIWIHGAEHRSMVGRAPPIGPYMWSLWMGLVYGSCAAVIYSLRRRIERTTRTLADATIARERNEAAITEARIQSMVERIEPSFLLDVMDAARRFYGTDVPRAEAIINECVEFLRTAMPQIRSGRSTLEAELDVAEAFLTLRHLTIDGCPSWAIDRGDDHEINRVAAKLALPPLVLLPVLERLMTRTVDRASPPRTLQLRLFRESDDLMLTIDSPSTDRAVVEEERIDAITVRLQRACGGSLVLVQRDDGGLRYVVNLPDAAPARVAAHAPAHAIPPSPSTDPHASQLETLR